MEWETKLLASFKSFWTELVRCLGLAGQWLIYLFFSNISSLVVELALVELFLLSPGDVQTVSWLVVRCFPPDLSKESSQCQEWLESYKDLLDAWEMYGPRCELDGAINEAGMMVKPPQQVYVSCNFCGSSVGQHIKGRSNHNK